jgi:hypothetical protein
VLVASYPFLHRLVDQEALLDLVQAQEVGLLLGQLEPQEEPLAGFLVLVEEPEEGHLDRQEVVLVSAVVQPKHSKLLL